MSVPSGRRKRSEKYPQLLDDVDYTMYALFESQFMFMQELEDMVYSVRTMDYVLNTKQHSEKLLTY